MRSLALLLAQGFGVGRVAWAPGTFGTLLAVPLYLVILPLSPVPYLLVVMGLFAAGVWICGVAGRSLGATDHPSIVWDEIVGFLVTMFAAPQGVWWVVGGFALFRLFDIWKPVPIRYLEQRLDGGWGVMVDDVLAGIYAGGILHVAAWAIAMQA